MMKRRIVLTPDQRREVVEIYLAGYSARCVAGQFGIAHQTVINILRAADAPVRFKGLRAHPLRMETASAPVTAGARMVPILSQDDARHALNIWARGKYTTMDIARMLMVSEAAVANSIGRFHGFTQGRAE